MNHSRRIVVTGMGALTPIGIGLDAYWTGLSTGTSGAAPITYFDTTGFETTFACELKDFDPATYLDRRTINRTDRYSQYALIAAEMAIKDSGIDLESVDRNRFGVVFGSGIGGFISHDKQFREYMNGGPRRVSPFFIPEVIPDMAAGLISIKYGLRGPNYATVSACATSINTIVDACMILRAGFADRMICGGSEAGITEMSVAGFNAAKALSTRNDEPARASRPYDADRDGFVIGEGAGAIVLETLEAATARGARIYGEILGLGMSADAYHMTAPHPEGEGALLSMQMALTDAGIDVGQIDYINTHGTSTELGDIAEVIALKRLLGDHARSVSLSSTKSMTGHLLGAAGVAESIACLLAMEHQTVPPTINVDNLDPAIDLDVTPNVARQRKIDYALNNGFGFGGHNATVIFGRYSG
jgi:3-oxoacyl-[acyl-carrier-protein] synthase II